LRLRRTDLQHLRQRLGLASPELQIGRVRADLASTVVALRASADRRVQHLRHDLDRTGYVLRALNPDALLRRGYAFIEDDTSGLPVTSARGLKPGDVLHATFADGHADASIIGVGDGADLTR